MTTYMKAFLIAGAAALVLMAAPAFAQHTDHEHGAAPAGPQASGDQQQAMMLKMMADMQAKQKTLDDLVAKMNAASGQDKIDLMAAVLTEMASMHKGMTCPMMQGAMKMSGDVQQHHVEHER
jgi:hypothetical protein